MVNTPKPKVIGHMPPAIGVSGEGAWGSAPNQVLEVAPIGVQDVGSTSYVKVDTVDILGSRDDSHVARRSRWSAEHADPDEVSLQVTNLDALGESAREELHSLIRGRLPSFHQFINGEVAPSVVSDLLLSAENIIVSNSHYESIEHFFGRNAMEGDYISEGEYGVFALPGDDHAGGIARRLGWDADVFTDLVQMARIANYEKWVSFGQKGSSWDTPHMERLYRMLRLLQEKAAIPDADAFVEMMFGKNETSARITMQYLVCIYGKAIVKELNFFHVIEVLLNATWGDEVMLLSKKAGQGEFLTGTAWYADPQDHMHVYAKGLADIAAAHMHGPDRRVSVAAVNYSLLGEQHLHGVGSSEGRYDFYLRELYRKEARKDLKEHPEEYYDDVHPVTKKSIGGVINNERALARLREMFTDTDFEDEASKITDAAGFIDARRALFRDLDLDVRWVEDVDHYARATLYALLSVAKFNQAGEEAMLSDPDFAKVSFSLARHMITVYEERRIVLHYLSGPVKKGVVDTIIQPFDMMMFNKLFDRIKRNQRKVASRKGPPPRRRK